MVVGNNILWRQMFPSDLPRLQTQATLHGAPTRGCDGAVTAKEHVFKLLARKERRAGNPSG